MRATDTTLRTAFPSGFDRTDIGAALRSRRQRRAATRAAASACWLLLVWAPAAVIPASGDVRSGPVHQLIDTILLTHGDDVPGEVVNAAVAQWVTCPAYGLDFPRFLRGTPGETRGNSPVVQIVSGGRNEGTACAIFSGRRIVLYSEAHNVFGTAVRCGARVANLAHELGHVLGLGHDARGLRDPIMGPVPRAGRDPRSVSAHDCAVVGSRWLTSAEIAGAVP